MYRQCNITENNNKNASQLCECITAAPQFQLSKHEAISIIEEIANVIIDNWKPICEESELSTVDKNLFNANQFFNPFGFEDLDDDSKHLKKLARKFKTLG